MKEFERESEVVKAYQWQPIALTDDGIFACRVTHNGTGGKILKTGEHAHLITEEGTLDITPGFWIVMGKEKTIMSPKRFELFFKEL